MCTRDAYVALDRILNILVGAPVPPWLQYEGQKQRHLVSPQTWEQEFDDKYGPDIPNDYSEHFRQCLLDIFTTAGEWKGRLQWTQTFECCIMRCEIRGKRYRNKKYLALHMPYFRPCAEGQGFFQKLIWTLRSAVITHEYEGLLWRSLDPSDENKAKSLGFTQIQVLPGQYPDAMITREELETKTENDWKYKTSYPPAAKLNGTSRSIGGG